MACWCLKSMNSNLSSSRSWWSWRLLLLGNYAKRLSQKLWQLWGTQALLWGSWPSDLLVNVVLPYKTLMHSLLSSNAWLHNFDSLIKRSYQRLSSHCNVWLPAVVSRAKLLCFTVRRTWARLALAEPRLQWSHSFGSSLESFRLWPRRRLGDWSLDTFKRKMSLSNLRSSIWDASFRFKTKTIKKSKRFTNTSSG